MESHALSVAGSEAGQQLVSAGTSGTLNQPSLSYVQSTPDAPMEGETPASPNELISKEEAVERLKVGGAAVRHNSRLYLTKSH